MSARKQAKTRTIGQIRAGSGAFQPQIAPPQGFGWMPRTCVRGARNASGRCPVTICWISFCRRPLKVVAGENIAEIAEPLRGRHNEIIVLGGRPIGQRESSARNFFLLNRQFRGFLNIIDYV